MLLLYTHYTDLCMYSKISVIVIALVCQYLTSHVIDSNVHICAIVNFLKNK